MASPSGAGWMPIPGGKHGGFRRHTMKGYEYWYPDGSAPKLSGADAFRMRAPEVHAAITQHADHGPTQEVLHGELARREEKRAAKGGAAPWLKPPSITDPPPKGVMPAPPVGHVQPPVRDTMPLTREAAFAKWFKDSAVKRKDGAPEEQHGPFNAPVVVYHGTTAGGFRAFDPTFDKGYNIYGKGFYFTEQKEIAEEYTKKDGDKRASATRGFLKDGKPALSMDGKAVSAVLHKMGLVARSTTARWSSDSHAYGSLGVYLNPNCDYNMLHALSAASDDRGNVDLVKLWSEFRAPTGAEIGGFTQPQKEVEDWAVDRFAKSIEQAAGVTADVPEAQVFQVYLSVKNPIDMEAEASPDDVKALARFLARGQAERQHKQWTRVIADKTTRLAERQAMDPRMIAANKLEHVEAQMKDELREAGEERDKAAGTLAKLDAGEDVEHHAYGLDIRDFLPPASKRLIDEQHGGPRVDYATFLALKQALHGVAARMPEARSVQLFAQTQKDVLTWGDVHHLITEMHSDHGTKAKFQAFAKSRGHDGLTHTGGWNIGSAKHKVWIAWEPTQIKATDSASFDPKDPDMWKSQPRVGVRVVGPPPEPNRDEFPFTGTINFQGILVYIENRKGSVRSGVGADGKKWSVRMKHDYGEIPGTRGTDGDAIDVFVGPNAAAPTAFVLCSCNPFPGSEDAAPGVYDEDKVFLGFDDEAAALAAYAANYDRPMFRPGVVSLPVADLRAMVYSDDLDNGAHVSIAKSDAAHPPGAGWMPIVGGAHGGFRRAVGKAGKKWEYWYPDQPQHHPRMERDPGRTSADVKPGDLVEVGGRSGLYRFTPDHEHAEGPPGEGGTWVTHVGTGSHEVVRTSTLTPVRKETPKPVIKTPPPLPQKPQQPGTATIGAWTGPIAATGPKPATSIDAPSALARRSKPFADSTAKPGTVLHDLEHGVFMLQKVVERGSDRFRLGVYVPPAKRNAIVAEFAKPAARVARKMCVRYGLPLHGPHGGASEQYKQILAGTHLGLVMALTNYQGGRPFEPLAERYMALHALREARGEMGATTIPDRQMKVLGTFIAARQQASTKSNGREPTPAEIAKHWVVRKKAVHQGELGSYRSESGRVIDQGDEEVPDHPWRVRTPAGVEAGEERPGKLALVESYAKLTQGDRVQDSEWLDQHTALPGLVSHLPAGTGLHLKLEAEQILAKLPKDAATVLRMKFGLHSPTGEEAAAPEIAAALGLTGAEASIRRAVAKKIDEAAAAFKRVATQDGAEVGRHVDKWVHRAPTVELDEFTGGGATHLELRERFGSDAAVHAYQTAVRAGQGSTAAPVLEAMRAGTAKPQDVANVHAIVSRQRDKERLETWKRFYAARAADTSERARSTHDTAKHDYMVTVAKHGGPSIPGI